MLIERTEKFQFDTETEATKMIEEYKNNAAEKGYTLAKAGYTQKFLKEKGEIIGELFTVTVTQKFI